MQFRHKKQSEEFNEIAAQLGLRWWFLGLTLLWVMISLMAGL